MWISKRRWIGMKRRIADLEAKAQSQQELIQKIILVLKEIGATIT